MCFPRSSPRPSPRPRRDLGATSAPSPRDPRRDLRSDRRRDLPPARRDLPPRAPAGPPRAPAGGGPSRRQARRSPPTRRAPAGAQAGPEGMTGGFGGGGFPLNHKNYPASVKSIGMQSSAQAERTTDARGDVPPPGARDPPSAPGPSGERTGSTARIGPWHARLPARSCGMPPCFDRLPHGPHVPKQQAAPGDSPGACSIPRADVRSAIACANDGPNPRSSTVSR